MNLQQQQQKKAINMFMLVCHGNSSGHLRVFTMQQIQMQMRKQMQKVNWTKVDLIQLQEQRQITDFTEEVSSV